MADRDFKSIHPDRFLAIGFVFAIVGTIALSLIAFPLAPVQAAPPTLIALSAGGGHTCVLTADHQVLCTGNNQYGQLGDGTFTQRTLLWPVSNLTNVEAISAGSEHTCAIDKDKKVWCWGRNHRGQLGNDSQDDSNVPSQVHNLTDVIAISAGGAHTCAIKTDNSVWCWGDNTRGRLGDGTTTLRLTPVQVDSTNLTGAKAISAGKNHTCAIKDDNTPWCWGDNSLRQVGQASGLGHSTPQPINIMNVTAISAGEKHTCVRQTGGQIWCWGNRNEGQLGDGSTLTQTHTPQAARDSSEGFPPISNATAISASDLHTCIIRADNSPWCWGDNRYGQTDKEPIGQRPDNTFENRTRAVPVPNLPTASVISAGGWHTCALYNGEGWCWGRNNWGQLGNTSTTDSPLPVKMGVTYAPTFTSSPNLASGTYGKPYTDHTFVVNANPGATFSITAGSLPPGLNLNPANGKLTGTPTQAGTYNFTVTASNGIAPDATQVVQMVIAKAPLTVRADDKTRVYGAANPPLTHTITGFVNNDPPTIVTGTPALSTSATPTTGIGQLPIVITQGTLATPNDNYSFTFVNGTLTISPRPLTVKADNKSKIYGAANPPLTYTATGLVNNDQLAGSLATTATTNSAVGSYPITQGTLANSNYTITFTPGTLTISKAPLTVTANNQTRTYGAPNPPLTFNAEGFVAGDTADKALTGSLATTAIPTSPVGTYSITQGTLAATNYTISFTGSTLEITPAALTVTADDQVRKIGSPNPEFTISYSGFVNNETPDVLTEPVIASTVADENSPPGEYPIVLSGGAATNYKLTLVNGILRVVEKDVPIITWNVPSLTYGMPLSDAELNATASFNDEPLAGKFTYNPPVGTVLNAGTGLTLTVLFTPTDQLNFEAVGKQVTIDVKPAPLTITADDKTMVAGEEVPALTARFEGLVNDDTEDSFDPPLTLTTEATSSSPPGTYPIVPSKAANPNYDITFVNGTLTIRLAGPVLESQNGNRGKPGSYFVFVAQGFEPDEQVHVAVNSTVVLTLQADSDGKLIFVLFFPPNAQPGVYTISVMSVAPVMASGAARMARTEITLDTDAPALAAPDDPTLPRASALPKVTVFLPLIVR